MFKIVTKTKDLVFVLFPIHLLLFKTIDLKLLIGIIILLFGIQIGFSQSYIYQHFGVDEGLPSSEVYDVLQDKHGNIWFATDKGLSYYNGYEFKNFTIQDGLPDNTILDFFPQENGQVWCYGYYTKTLFYFNTNFNGFTQFKYNDTLKTELSYQSSNSVIKSVRVSNDGTLQVGGYGIAGYIEVDINGNLIKKLSLKTFKLSKQVKFGIRNQDKLFFTLYHDYKNLNNTIIVEKKHHSSTRFDVRFLDDNNAVFIDKKLGIVSKEGVVQYFSTEHNPIGIKRVSNTTFFVGYYGNGSEIRDIEGRVLDTFLPHKSVSGFLIDAEGGYWFTTIDDGVFYVKNPEIKVYSKTNVSSLVKDNYNKLYGGFDNGDIALLLKKTPTVLHKGLSTDNAVVEFDSKNNHLYGYSDYKVINFTTGKTIAGIFGANLPEKIANPLLSNATSVVYSLKNGEVIDYKTNYKIKDVCMYKNEVLLGTPFGLVIKNDTIFKTQHLSNLLKPRIDDIDVNDKAQKAYMATQGNGVVVYGDSIYNISKKDGLTNNIISEVHVENDSTVWACSNSGLNRITFKPNNRFEIKTLTKSEGLLSNDINDVEIVNDTVWVATKKGLCFFDKNVFNKKNYNNVLSLQLKEVLVNSAVVDTSVEKFRYNQNSITFKLQGVSPRNTNQIDYQYRLKEVDTTWESSSNRLINFPSLSPGTYTFQAKVNAFNQSDPFRINYRFTISPPFWKSWWFYSLCLLVFTGLVYLFFKIRVLTYNKDVFRELIRLVIKRLNRKELFYKFRSNGEDNKIPTREILYVNSQGNYLDIVTLKKTYTIRCKIGDFIKSTPDSLEYIRLHRSYIVRIDKIVSKGKKWVVVNDKKVPVGDKYLEELNNIQF